MRRLYVFIFMAIFLIMSSCSSNKYRVVYVYSDEFKSLAEYSFKYNMEKSLDNFKTLNITSDEKFVEYFDKLLSKKKNNNNVYIISKKFSNIDISDKVKKLVYINSENVNTNNLLINQKSVAYILGVISGVVTRKNSISILYSEDYVDYKEIMDSFVAGIKEVNLRAYDLLSDLENVKYVTTSNIDEVQSFISSNNSDIIFNISKEVIDVNDKFLFNLNMDDISKDLLTVLYDYEGFINMIEGDEITDYSIGVKEGNIKFNLSNMSKELVDVFNKYLSNIV